MASNSQVFDLGLMLNVHMWVHKQHGTEGTKAIMRNICSHVKHFFFQTAHAQSAGMYLVKELQDIDQVKHYLKEVGFTDIVEINRNTWHNEKNRTLFYCKGQG